MGEVGVEQQIRRRGAGMKIENIEVYGFRAALRGMRNPMNSWDSSDSSFYPIGISSDGIGCVERPMIGPRDLMLATKLVRAGGTHRKFLCQITILWDITIPRAIWQELDTYKVATVRNSCSTMHKLGSRDLEPSDMLNRLNYLALKMWFDRHDHRMPEWSGADGICWNIQRLPYMNNFIDAMFAGMERGNQ